jgi:hypothetical protein
MKPIKLIIKSANELGRVPMVGIHAVIHEAEELVRHLEEADRDGFETVIAYLHIPSSWMTDFDFRTLARDLRFMVAEFNDGRGEA